MSDPDAIPDPALEPDALLDAAAAPPTEPVAESDQTPGADVAGVEWLARTPPHRVIW